MGDEPAEDRPDIEKEKRAKQGNLKSGRNVTDTKNDCAAESESGVRQEDGNHEVVSESEGIAKTVKEGDGTAEVVAEGDTTAEVVTEEATTVL